MVERLYVAIEYFMLRQSVAKLMERFCVVTEQFYVTIEFTRVGRISVTTEDFYAVTELTTIKIFVAHNKAGHAKVGAHNSVAPCGVTTEEARCTRQTRPGAHDRPWARTTKVHERQGNYVATEGRGSKELYFATGLFLVATERCVGCGN